MMKKTNKDNLLQVINMVGSQVKLAKLLGVSRIRINQWLNDEGEVPLLHAIVIETITHGAVIADQLTQKYHKVRQSLRTLINRGPQSVQLVSLKKISFGQNTELAHQPITLEESQEITNRPIIVDNHACLISGVDQVRSYLSSGRRAIPARVFNLKKILKKGLTAQESLLLLLSEQTLLGLALEDFHGKHQGKRMDLKKKNEKNTQLPPNWAEVKKNKETRTIIAHAIGMTPTTYERSKKVVLHGTKELIDAMDQKIVSISKASALSKLAHKKQIPILKSLYKQQLKDVS